MPWLYGSATSLQYQRSLQIAPSAGQFWFMRVVPKEVYVQKLSKVRGVLFWKI